MEGMARGGWGARGVPPLAAIESFYRFEIQDAEPHGKVFHTQRIHLSLQEEAGVGEGAERWGEGAGTEKGQDDEEG